MTRELPKSTVEITSRMVPRYEPTVRVHGRGKRITLYKESTPRNHKFSFEHGVDQKSKRIPVYCSTKENHHNILIIVCWNVEIVPTGSLITRCCHTKSSKLVFRVN